MRNVPFIFIIFILCGIYDPCDFVLEDSEDVERWLSLVTEQLQQPGPCITGLTSSHLQEHPLVPAASPASLPDVMATCPSHPHVSDTVNDFTLSPSPRGRQVWERVLCYSVSGPVKYKDKIKNWDKFREKTRTYCKIFVLLCVYRFVVITHSFTRSLICLFILHFFIHHSFKCSFFDNIRLLIN